jgi:uncharacterized protein (DUF1778 family)
MRCDRLSQSVCLVPSFGTQASQYFEIKLIMASNKPKQPTQGNRMAVTSSNESKQPERRRSGTINLRVGEAQKEVIERAAAIQGKSRTEFILDAAYRSATSFLLDRKFFLVDDATFEAFERQLEAEPDPQQLTALKALLERPAPWD